MKLAVISKLILVGLVGLGLVACAKKAVPVPVKAPRHVCDIYAAHTAGLKDGIHRQTVDYDYAKTNNCIHNEHEINKEYLAGYKDGRQIK